ncbi:hypothetical protein BH10PLA1_BH10PLA1_15650 [soil metagenome]
MRHLTLIALLLFIAGQALAAEPVPATQPTSQPTEPLIGEMRVATLEPTPFLFVQIETSLQTISQDAEPAIDKLIAIAKQNKIHFSGGVIFRYLPGFRMDGPFQLQIGFRVLPSVAAPAGARLEKLPAFKCATVNYTGPMTHLNDCYAAAVAAIREAGLKPVGEFRESYFYWESFDSQNDVTQIQIAVE